MEEQIIEELKNELQESKAEIKSLKVKYEQHVDELKSDITYLKEKLMAQQGMLSDAVDYADKLGVELKHLKKRLDSGDFQSA